VKRIILPFICLFVLIHSEAFSQTRALDSIALRAFYTATDGTHWITRTSWLTGPINTWHGITLNSSQRVIKIDLPSNGLSGKLPNAIGNLTGLRWLILNGNSLMDTLPKSLGNLSALVTLDIKNNWLNGDLPELVGMSSLAELYLQNNRLTFSDLKSSGLSSGSIDIFGYAPQDTMPSISYNINNGTITVDVDVDPANRFEWYKNSLKISETTQTIIPPGEGLYNCRVTNTVYPGLTLNSHTYNFSYSRKSDSLALVSLYNATNGPGWGSHSNWLITGKSINTWRGITLDANQRVSKIKLNSNQLKGTLPTVLANLSKLVYLKIDNNQLKGNLPPLDRVSTVDSIWVEHNRYDFANLSNSQIQPGDIKSFIYSPQDTIPNLIYNQYEGTLTVGAGVDANNIYSWFLDEVSIPESTRTIVIREGGSYNCVITNSVYTGMTFYSDTADVYFSIVSDSLALVHLYNDTDGPHWKNSSKKWLNGPVSNWFGVTVTGNRVRKVLLGNNGLSGTIPSQICNLALLTELNLSENQLVDSIPSDIGLLTLLTSLKLNNNQLSGNIPLKIFDLDHLTNLSLEYNQLTGTIPVEIGNLISLTSLKLSNNQLTGSIPVQIGNLTDLDWLSLANNQLTGSIPTEIEYLTVLTGLEFGGNELTGNIPVELCNLTGLNELSMNNNQLSGNIPNEINQLTNLTFLSLSDNNFTGSIPAGLDDLSGLTELHLQNNQLSGIIPSEIGYLTSLNTLNLRGNILTGSIPADIEKLTGLVSLYLDSNQFVGDLPLLTKASYLADFSVDHNKFTFSNLLSSEILPEDINHFLYAPQDTLLGLKYEFAHGTLTVSDDGEPENEFTWYKDSIQLDETTKILTMKGEGRYNCEVVNPLFPDLTLYSDTFIYSYSTATDSIALVALYDSTGGSHWTNHANWLSGALSSWSGVTLDGSRRVSELRLNGNHLKGVLPSEIGNLNLLILLYLYNDSLSGSIPAEISELDRLNDLRLHNNQLSGSIPAGIGELTNLSTLYLNNNQFSGVIPTEIDSLTELTYLSLNNNQLSGSIPGGFGYLDKLRTLNLSQNQLSGNVPSEMGGMSKIEYLYLSNNQITGNIPSSFGNLSTIKTLNLYGNTLSGTIPAGIGDLDNLNNLNIGNNKFHFIDIEPVIGWSISTFTYSPQAKIGLAQTIPGYVGSPLRIRIVGYVAGDYDTFQWYKNNILQVGKTDSVFNIPTYAESNSGIYRCVVTNSVATSLTLTSNDITVETHSVPETLTLTNISVGSGTTVCYDATQDITVAGGSTTVNLLNGSNTTFIAGHSIRFLPGFHAQSGSIMDAYITTTASFCENPMLVIALDELSEKSITDKNIQNQGKTGDIEKLVKIFPNPNNGRFMIELCNFEKPVKVSVINITGATVYPEKWIDSDFSELELSGIDKGMYFVRINDGISLLSKKIIVQ
jgi:Leucine-rich repeat (LRR) protein